MIEIKCVGRGGQGAVTFSQILAIAAFEDGKYCQAMPSFGVERRGAPSFSYTRIDEKPINIRSLIYEPDVVVVLDASLLSSLDITDGLEKNGILIVNSKKSPKELGITGNFKIFTVDASSSAMKHFGADIVNTAMLGAFSKATGLVSMKGIYKGIEERFKQKKEMIDLNKKVIDEVYKHL
ncbi:2-oxoacid:acceptor oxidoreductase family protein [Candidatus Woesearchaeota archaeon]|nr:2-oxoacid:acceptor oxidoreductase family protein [Candidatus Woesearchaeota archaeon]